MLKYSVFSGLSDATTHNACDLFFKFTLTKHFLYISNTNQDLSYPFQDHSQSMVPLCSLGVVSYLWLMVTTTVSGAVVDNEIRKYLLTFKNRLELVKIIDSGTSVTVVCRT